MKKEITRRHFIEINMAAASATAFPAIIPASALGEGKEPAPSHRITVGCIGVGPQGRGVMNGFLRQEDVRVVAVCDVAKRNLDQARSQVNQKYQNNDCATYHDFRDLLARKDIDAVLIATPDHWHVPVAVASVRAGKDIYLEKPLGLSVEENQLLRQAVQEHKRVFQFGTQQRSSAEFRRACELVRSGRIGQLKQINVWCSASRPGGSAKPAPVPEGLDYDRWLGPAPSAPYTDGKCFDNDPPGTWKTWWFNYDYALGFIAGWGVHPLDIAYWGHPAMMDAPFDLDAKAVFPTEGACNTAIAWDVNFAFADGVRMRFKGTPNGYNEVTELNDLQPWHTKYGKAVNHGTAFEGTDGWVMAHRGGLRTSPEKLAQEKAGPTDIRLFESPGHVRNFLDAVKSRGTAICPIEEAVRADFLCHLSDIATRLNRKLKWNPTEEKFVKDDEANRKLALRPMREPWRWS